MDKSEEEKDIDELRDFIKEDIKGKKFSLTLDLGEYNINLYQDGDEVILNPVTDPIQCVVTFKNKEEWKKFKMLVNEFEYKEGSIGIGH